MGTTNWLKRLRMDESGNVVVLGAAVMPMLIGSAALAVDTIQLSMWKRQLQRQADSAALAGAYAVDQSKPAAAAVARDLQHNDQVPLKTTVVNNAPLSGPYAGNTKAVEVLLTSQRRLPFIGFFMSTAPIIEARSVAAKVGGDNVCLLALETNEKLAISFNGNANVNLGCGVASNSNNSEAVKITGNFTLGATVVKAVGGIEVSGNANFPVSKRKPNSTAEIDPFGTQGRNINVPTLPTACTHTGFKVENSASVTMEPGRYCGTTDLNTKGVVTMNPGVYIFAGETFKINGDTTLNGNGVTIFLTSDGGKMSTLDWNGNAQINLSAPTVASGSPYAGLLVMGDRAAATSTDHKINGNLSATLRGALYFPTARFNWNGNTTVQTQCLQVIARLIDINGNPSIPNQCTANDGAPGFLAPKVRLVE